jgi:DNA-binding NtrC family response regulator
MTLALVGGTHRTVPLALRERPEDVPVLAARYLAELSARHGMPLCTLSPAAVEVLQGYAWPGNVRELENVLERAVMFASGEEIDPDSLAGLMNADRDQGARLGEPSDDTPPPQSSTLAAAATRGIVSATSLPGVFRVEPRLKPPQPAAPAAGEAEAWPTLADVERMHLERTLATAMNNKSLAAKLLGIDRSVLRRKLKTYGLDDTPEGGPE